MLRWSWRGEGCFQRSGTGMLGDGGSWSVGKFSMLGYIQIEVIEKVKF